MAWAKQKSQETEIKAAILFNLVRFSDWPETSYNSDNRPLTLCTRTNDSMQEALGKLRGKPLKDHHLSVLHLESEDGKFERCHILYLSEDMITEDVDFEVYNAKNILTIGDSVGLLEKGAGMSIQRAGKKIRFSINRKAVEAAGISPSSKILSLAVAPK